MPLVQRLADCLGVGIERALPTDLPPVVANQTALRQALLTALSCLIESAPGGRVWISAAERPDGIDLTIRAVAGDQAGPVAGIDDARLALARRLLELQGSRLEIQRDGSRDASVCLRLVSPRGPTVLIIDDNPDVRLLFQRYLQAIPYRLIQATSADQALQLVAQVEPRLIILDLMMPFRDGWDLLQILQRDPRTRSIPIVVCSVVHERTLALTMGAAYFLPKPVSQAALLEVLELCGLWPLHRLQARLQAPHELPDREAIPLSDREKLRRDRLVREAVASDQNDRNIPQAGGLSHPTQ